jgi:hypothetical protein
VRDLGLAPIDAPGAISRYRRSGTGASRVSRVSLAFSDPTNWSNRRWANASASLFIDLGRAKQDELAHLASEIDEK